jgi:hypothetical protein
VCSAGSLLSTHVLLTDNPAIMPEYNGCLLRLAEELGDRLLPAFDTPHGIPLSWVNLRKVSRWQGLLCEIVSYMSPKYPISRGLHRAIGRLEWVGLRAFDGAYSTRMHALCRECLNKRRG